MGRGFAPLPARCCGTQQNSREVVTTAARSLLMYVAKLRDNPGTPRYRRVPRGNKQYRSSLEPAGGHQAVLTALGFVNSGRAFEHSAWGAPYSALASL